MARKTLNKMTGRINDTLYIHYNGVLLMLVDNIDLASGEIEFTEKIEWKE